ncbi:MAG TPA: hypothetical protein VGM20_10015 [Gemmatimonadales bacterium]
MRFVQQPRDHPASPLEWIFAPHGRRERWAAAREHLSRAPKPLIAAPLAEPGMIALWNIGTFDDEQRVRAEQRFANQLQWLNKGITHLGLAPTDLFLFETDADQFELPVAELARWLGEYATMVPWTIGEGVDTRRRARLMIRRSNGDWSPGKACHFH